MPVIGAFGFWITGDFIENWASVLLVDLVLPLLTFKKCFLYDIDPQIELYLKQEELKINTRNNYINRGWGEN